jgi:uroporphyrin-III C-methyltransferase
MSQLIVVGSGIKAGAHMTLETKSWIENADVVLYLAADPVTQHQITSLNKNTRSLFDCYHDGEYRFDAYRRMIGAALRALQEYQLVCVVFYGHPGVFVYPSFQMMHEARRAGHVAQMLPAISADSCLYADLEIDPARNGCQSFEATDFLLHDRVFDCRSLLILWQVGLVCDASFKALGYTNDKLSILVDRLRRFYPDDHEVIIYEASQYAISTPKIHRCELRNLILAPITPASTFVAPPLRRAIVKESRLKELGLTRADVIIDPQAGAAQSLGD